MACLVMRGPVRIVLLMLCLDLGVYSLNYGTSLFVKSFVLPPDRLIYRRHKYDSGRKCKEC